MTTPPTPPAPEPERREILLTEYQCAQESAHHHDTLLWEVTAIVWGAESLLVGFLLEAVGHAETSRHLVQLAALLGVFLTFFLVGIVFINNWVMNEKYIRCREIERELRMEQHQRMAERYPRGTQRLFSILVNSIFLLIWVYVICRPTG